MTTMNRKKFLFMLLMFIVSGIANYARPTKYLAQSHPRALLATEIPDKINGWIKAPSYQDMIIDPEQQVVLDYLYADLINASYVNTNNNLVMLSIAYGKDQSDGHDVHKPELCYPAQGFTRLEERDIPIVLDPHRSVMVHYMKMQRGQRTEPLYYWTLAGDYVYRSKWKKRLIAFRYSLDNLIPDGMIIRVSILENNNAIAQDTLTNFVINWYASLTENQRTRYFGEPDS